MQIQDVNELSQSPKMIALLLKVAEEFKAPVSFAIMVVLCATVAWLVQDHVSKDDFGRLREQLGGVQYTLAHDHLDTRIHSVQTEMFNLQQHITDEKAKGHDTDGLYYRRLDELKGQEEELSRAINVLEHQRQ